MRSLLALAVLTALALPASAADFPRFEAQEIAPHVGNVCYALTVADVNGDQKPDVVALTEDAIVWFSNPDWAEHTIIRGATARDNVCIQPHDIDGDGQIDFALGAGWRPSDTQSSSTLQWVGRNASGQWTLHDITEHAEPTLHRFRWADVRGTGKPQLIVAPLQGRGTKGPNWGEGNGVNIIAYTIPDDPTKTPWPSVVLSDNLHTVHNLWVVDHDGDGRRDDILLAAWEGVFVLSKGRDGQWLTTKIGTGDQESSPNKGASEIKRGRFANGHTYIATIEPWHGNQVVVYLPPTTDGQRAYTRQVLDRGVTWGHAVWCDDLDGDGSEELIIGQRDPRRDANASPKGPGVWVYDLELEPAGSAVRSTKHVIDDGGMACEDALTADLNGDGRPDIIAGGRATHNVKIYWNRGQ